MKITKEYLKRLVKESLEEALDQYTLNQIDKARNNIGQRINLTHLQYAGSSKRDIRTNNITISSIDDKDQKIIFTSNEGEEFSIPFRDIRYVQLKSELSTPTRREPPSGRETRYEREKASDAMAKENMKENKITKGELRQIIKEEYERIQQEVRYGGAFDSRGEYTGDPTFDEDDENLEFVVKRLAKRYDDFKKSGAAEKFPNLAKRIESFLKSPESEGGLPASAVGSEFIERIAGILKQ